ncbi:MAG: carboxypeptidase regulatory-like domain-containing protein, partial [Acidobacteria bacterium]|nr:carboxypeptidase regulatory-like domain-containing protein [Acidobacteriota bacterium]
MTSTLCCTGLHRGMTSTSTGRACAVIAFVIAVAAYPVPAAAQSGQLKGKVIDAQNKAVEGAKILMAATDTGRKFETKTNGKGEFIQIGLPPGNYQVTASK